MSAKKSSARHGGKNGARTWIEINSAAVRKNIAAFRELIGPKKLWAVVKSNAYGHGLPVFPKLADKYGVDGFCVDSLVEGLRLRKEGIKKPILVLGFTLPQRFEEAAKNDITVTVSNIDSLKALKSTKKKPSYHLKIDTGMHRQGFYPEDLQGVGEYLDKNLSGVYSHFAAAKDADNSLQSLYTAKQFADFKSAAGYLKEIGFGGITRHVAATAGAIVDPEYFLDAVRIGIGLYGLFPSGEIEDKFSDKIKLEPVLSWRAIISEIKDAVPGGYIGYDLTEKIEKPLRYALLPVGYWHGLPRLLSGKGEVLVNGKRARILGRVSMDMTVVDVSGIECSPGDAATIIGADGDERISATEQADIAATSHYEFLTRLNPLMEKITV